MAKQQGFRIVEQDIEFTHMNTRLEKNGPNEKKSAVDLSMNIQMENEVLDSILPGLRGTFYGKPGKDDGGDLADKGKADQPIRLKYPALANQTLDTEWGNYNLTFHYGITGKSDLLLEDCTVKSMRIELHDGGTVDLYWKVAAHPTDEQYARRQERLRAGKVGVTLVKGKQVQKQKDMLDNAPEANPVAATPEQVTEGAPVAANDGKLPEAWPFPADSDKRADPSASLG